MSVTGLVLRQSRLQLGEARGEILSCGQKIDRVGSAFLVELVARRAPIQVGLEHTHAATLCSVAHQWQVLLPRGPQPQLPQMSSSQPMFGASVGHG